MQDLSQALQWRYATKAFDANKKLTDDQVSAVLEAGRLAPSSYGLQPWKFVVVETKELREKIKAAAWNQSQVTDASHLIVVAVQKTLSAADPEKLISAMASEQGVSASTFDGYKSMMIGTITSMPEAEHKEWNARQAYIALGFMMLACALHEIDSCPMEGFDPAQVDAILDLESQGLTSVVLLPIGLRATSDSHATDKKVRYAASEIVHRV